MAASKQANTPNVITLVWGSLRLAPINYICSMAAIASSPGPSHILPRSRGEKSGEGLGAKLRHGPEMVDSVSTN